MKYFNIQLNTILLFTMTFLLFSCNQKEIKNKRKEIESLNLTISQLLQNKIRYESELKQLNQSKKFQKDYVDKLIDSTRSVVLESPFASSYIMQFDQKPIEVLQEYAETASDEERDKLLVAHFLLMAYGATEYGQKSIRTARIQLTQLNQEKSRCAELIANLNTQIVSMENNIASTESEIMKFNSELSKANTELEELKKSWWDKI